MALKPGQGAPNFTLPSTSGSDFTLNEDFKGKACIIYFYPWDFTKGCTAEACGFRDSFQEFTKVDISIVGISRDNLSTHKQFIKEHALPFELLSDEEGKVCKAYDALIPFLKIPKRVTYLLDRNHRVWKACQDMFDAKKHIENMRSTLKENQ